jgi:hypothetical protein
MMRMELDLTCPHCDVHIVAAARLARGIVGQPPPEAPPVRFTVCDSCAEPSLMERDHTGQLRVRALTDTERADIAAIPGLVRIIDATQRAVRSQGRGTQPPTS